MSFSQTRPCRIGRRAAVVICGLALAGCGFRPVSAPEESGGTPSVEQLSAVRIEPLRDRAGQQLHNFLRDELNPNGQPVDPDYKLHIELSLVTFKHLFSF